MNKVVARFVDGRVVKGVATDFLPTRDHFHVNVDLAPPGSRAEVIQTKDLKALFFVKDFTGDPRHVEQKEFDPGRPPPGRKIKVEFRDGEVLVGTTTGYQPGRPGFFLVPADPKSNMERCYVVTAAARSIAFM